jgi:hypothetical protein
MKSAALRNDAVAIAFGVVWLALAFVVVGLAERIEGYALIDGPVLIALMLLPLVVYFVASGKLTRLKGLGFEAKFAEKAEETVRPAAPIAYNDPQIVAREGVRKLLAQVRQINKSRPVVMTMTIGGGQYTVKDVKRYLDVLSQLRGFKLVVFLDSDKRVVAYMEAWALKELVEQTETEPELAGEFVQSINSGPKESVTVNPSVTERMISTTSTNIEALREMQEQNLEALVVVNQQGMLCGVVERDQVITSIILSLAG